MIISFWLWQSSDCQTTCNSSFSFILETFHIRIIKSQNYILCSLQVKHLYGITVFEDYLYATSSDNFNIIRINRFNGTDIHSIIKMESARGIRTYQKRTQPTGKPQGLFKSLHNSSLNGNIVLVLLCGVKEGIINSLFDSRNVHVCLIE